jgi:uncharacterized protein (DUF3084 family)
MNHSARYVLPGVALLVAAGAGCAGKQQGPGPSPVSQEVAASQQRTEEALQRARQAQDLATEQARKATDAEAVVRQDQEKLALDQQTVQRERAKAQQLQLQAKRESELAAAQMQRNQALATGALEQQMQRTARGEQLAAGLVTEVRPDELSVQPRVGNMMSFGLTGRTQVTIEGRKATAGQITPGSEARVSYEASTEGPRALSVEVTRAAKKRLGQ